MKYIELLKQ